LAGYIQMSAQTNDEPILELDGKKYVISELSDDAKYFINCLNSVQVKLQNLKMEHDTLMVSQEGFTSRLKAEVEKPEEVSEEEGA
jgi:uncharacterized protein (DUF2344 family)